MAIGLKVSRIVQSSLQGFLGESLLNRNRPPPATDPLAANAAAEAAARRAAVYRWMDAMRALAALAVVLTHARDFLIDDFAGDWRWAPFYLATGLGHQAVIVFFVLSGFWVGRNVLRERAAADFWRRYLVNRGTRLYVVFLPALALGGLLDLAGSQALALPFYQANATHSFPGLEPGSLTAVSLLGNILFIQTILVPCFGSNGPLWSLAGEFWFYMWFPLLLGAARGRPRLALATLGLAVLNPALLAYFAIWLFGAAVSRLDNGTLERRPKATIVAAGMAFAAALVLARWLPGLAGDVLLGFAFAAFLLALLRYPRRLASPPPLLVSYGGNASYSLYAVHFPVLVFAVAALGLERQGASFAGAGGVVALTGAAVALGGLFATLTEAHTGRARRRLMRALGTN